MSHRSTTYPCFLPDLGEFSRSWSHKTYPLQKYEEKNNSCKILLLEGSKGNSW